MWFDDLSDREEAGWFQESNICSNKFGSLWAMTPTHKLLPIKPNSIILLSTGGFAPIHDGHIAMMEVAKSYMESKGYHIRGGYVSPGHDEYVVNHKNIALHSPQRLALANDKLVNHPWLMVDPWEAIGCNCAVNFTSVIDHLEQLLHSKICYVVGSDNQRFSLAFKNQGLICVVQRTTDVKPNPKYKSSRYSGSNIFLADNKPIAGNSTIIRQNFQSLINKKKLILQIDNTSEVYIDQLISILQDYYLDIRLVRNQNLPKIDNLISLHQMIPSSFGNLEICRNYIPGGYYKLGYINRPNSPSLDKQLKSFANKKVSLFDDDIVSGGTMRHATFLLDKVNCQVVSHHSFSFSNSETEIMDSRDFLPIPHGGLVVEGKRVPYIYPFVCPYVRASILPDQAVEFSDRIHQTFWENI